MLLPRVPAAISKFETDRVLKVIKGQRVVASGVYDQFVVDTDGIYDQFYVGIYSIDGGDNWYEFGISPLTYWMGMPQFNPDIFFDGDWRNFVGEGFNIGINQITGSTLTFDYMFALIDKGDYISNQPLSSDDNYQFRSGYNYQKIAVNNVTLTSTPAKGNVPGEYHDVAIDHNLGYIPRILTFIDGGGWNGIRSTNWWFGVSVQPKIIITETQVIWRIWIHPNDPAYNWTLYTRIYYDD